MTAADLVAALALAAVVAYAVLAGADFGGGVWDALARGPRRAAQRDAIAHAMGPVWEANHVWLIFVIVLLFTGFPRGFAALSVGLFAPFHLALLGITLRGAAFVFRAYGPLSPAARARWGAVFGAASAVTPVLLGACIGAVSSGALRVDPTGAVRAGGAWTSPLAGAIGLLALAVCAYTAAVFLTVETDGALREDFRRRALRAGGVAVAGSVLVLPLLRTGAPHLWRGLTSGLAAVVCVAPGAACALASGALIYARRYRAARAATVAHVALLVAGWGAAQYPYLVYPDLTLAGSAAPAATLRFVLWTVPPGAALLGPALWLLFRVFKSHAPARGAHDDAGAGRS